MNLPTLKIGSKTASVPIIQGGMGVGVSLSNLASAVANEGGIGVISGVQIGFKEDDFDKNTDEANVRALKKEIRKARTISPEGILGVNLMVAMKNYKDMVQAAIDEGIDLIISGAGFPRDLPKLVEGSDVKIVPIASSPKAAALITRLWLRRYDRLPDLMIVEGPDAGGHLGFPLDELEGDEYPNLEEIVKDTIQILKPFEEKKGKRIPIIAAGGIFDGSDIKRFLELGADGVQMGTRFVATEECDASIEFKNAYINVEKEDIDYILSPVGMPGQAIINPFIERVTLTKDKITKCYNCLTPCDPKISPYCISQALINSVTGDVDNGLIFIGKKGYKLKEIISVKALIDELVEEIKRS